MSLKPHHTLVCRAASGGHGSSNLLSVGSGKSKNNHLAVHRVLSAQDPANSNESKRVRELRKFAGSKMPSRTSSTSADEPPEPPTGADRQQRTRFFSSPTEMKSRERRRSLRRERYYGTVELVVSVDACGKVRNARRFRLEPGSEVAKDEYKLPRSPVIVENPQRETRWYVHYFLGQEHQNFAGIDPQTRSPFFFSVMIEDSKPGDDSDENKLCRAILWLATGPRKLGAPYQRLSRPVTAKSVLQQFVGMTDYNRSLKEITAAKLQKDLVILEDQEGTTNCKFGVIFAKSGQQSDSEMLSTEHSNDAFESFLKLLGNRVQLNGWGSYKGGLDTSTNSTGTESIFAMFSGHEIMFHISTLLPYSSENKQQIERKRHIGNDIVNIIFEADGDPKHPTFNPSMMKSHFTHIFALITFEESTKLYRLWVFSEESVPAYGPSLPYPSEFKDPAQFREFLLTKLINGEKAAYQARVFIEKRQRTCDTLIKDMYMEYLKDCPKGLQKMTDSVIKHFLSPIRKDPLGPEAFDFVKYGELVKLDKMLSGDVSDFNPTQMSWYRDQPWEPRLLMADTPSCPDVLSSDSLGNLSILLASEETGTHFLGEGLYMPVVDVNVQVHQLSVLEEFGLFLLRSDRGRDSAVSVFPLTDVRLAIKNGERIPRKRCNEFRIPATKGCHLYQTSDAHGLRLYVVVFIGKKLVLQRWGFGPLGPIEEGTNLSKHFTQLHEVQLNDEALAAAVFESGSQGTVRACVATKNNFCVVDFSHGLTRTLDWRTCPKSSTISVLAQSDSDSEEILYTYDNVTMLLESADSTPQEIFWTSNVRSVVYRFPFIVAFFHDALEVRLVINGNLLSTIYMPGVRMLASKDDIIFASERSYQELGSKGKEKPSKRWDLYCIPCNKLCRRDTNRFGANWRATPQMRKSSKLLRTAKVPHPPSPLAGTAIEHDPTIPGRPAVRGGQPNNSSQDSGYGHNGTDGSCSLDVSAPSSPFCAVIGDVFEGDVVL